MGPNFDPPLTLGTVTCITYKPPHMGSHLITGGQSIHKTFGFGFSTQEDFARGHLAQANDIPTTHPLP